MKKKFLILAFGIFTISNLANASQTFWLDCIDHDVPVCTVDEDYFDNEADYKSYIRELMEIYC